MRHRLTDYLKKNISFFLILGSVKDEYIKLFQSFKTAWNSCRSFLGEQGNMAV